MHGYQIKLLWEKLIEIHGLILSQSWIQLKRVAVISDETIEEAKIEIEAYPGSMTECPYDEFTDAVTINSFDGWNADCMAYFWFDDEESDLSMDCTAEFNGREMKRIYINQIHVF